MIYLHFPAPRSNLVSTSQLTSTVYQVSDLANEMRRLMETSYPEIWIEGELSSLSTPASGHLYFSLKDQQSQLRCAMFRNRANINRYRPKAGDLVRVRAKISVYTARGDLQCIVQHIEEAGEGLLQRQFEELKLKLNQEGLFANDHKLQIPAFAKHIGLVTSPSGAAVKDILSTLNRRCPGIPVTLYPAVVQGDSAAGTLIQALADIIQHNRCDVIIIGRGGGSLEDLWCFNDEQLARAIYNCPIPIVSAVGHEVDVSIADYVADLRAPTPTAAAELLSPDNTELEGRVGALGRRLRFGMQRYFEVQGQRVDQSYNQLKHPKSVIETRQKDVSHLGTRLKHALTSRMASKKAQYENCLQQLKRQTVRTQITHKRQSTSALSQRLLRAQQYNLKHHQQQFEKLGSQLHLVSPLATLDRGFAIVRNKESSIIRDSQTVKPGDALSVQLNAGKLHCDVTEIDS